MSVCRGHHASLLFIYSSFDKAMTEIPLPHRSTLIATLLFVPWTFNTQPISTSGLAKCTGYQSSSAHRNLALVLYESPHDSDNREERHRRIVLSRQVELQEKRAHGDEGGNAEDAYGERCFLKDC